jgi:metallo-beta-lactamase family protein
MSVSGYSGHADQAGLVEFVQAMPSPPRQVVLVHGEPRAKRALQRALEQVLVQSNASTSVFIAL